MKSTFRGPGEVVRYAVVGLGHIAQAAVLPAFRQARENSQLTALVSGDPVKLAELAKKYKGVQTYSYDEYDAALASDAVDAVYIALPNHLHCPFSVRASAAGKHVLCEKPMAVTEEECQRMIDAASANHVRLMIAYRLHFEEANLKAVRIVESGELGEPRFFSALFSRQAKEGGIRLDRESGGGTLYDIGIYCINAARYLFRDEPVEVSASSVQGDDRRFDEVDEMTSGVLRFSDNRLAQFVSSFGASDVSQYRVVGTRGDLRVEPAFSYSGKLVHHLTIDGKTTRQAFAKRDQFAAELIYFSHCIQTNQVPEPSGIEGLADVRIIEALHSSAATGEAVAVRPVAKRARPRPVQDIQRPPTAKPEYVHVESPHE